MLMVTITINGADACGGLIPGNFCSENGNEFGAFVLLGYDGMCVFVCSSLCMAVHETVLLENRLRLWRFVKRIVIDDVCQIGD